MRLNSVVTAFVAVVAVTSCSGDGSSKGGESAAARAARAHRDSAGGEVSQLMMPPRSLWLTDSNVVALAMIVNRGPADLARVESARSTNAQIHVFAVDLLREHAAFQQASDSIAAKRRIPAQRPAVANEFAAPYDSAAARLAVAPTPDLARQFLAAEIESHTRATADLAALAGNSNDVDLRTLLAVRGIGMEQAHLARAKLLMAAIVGTDSGKKP